VERGSPENRTRNGGHRCMLVVLFIFHEESRVLFKGIPLCHDHNPVFVPMSPPQPQFSFIRSSRLPMRPVTPGDPGRICCVVIMYLALALSFHNKHISPMCHSVLVTTLVGGNDVMCRAPVRRQRREVSRPCTCMRPRLDVSSPWMTRRRLDVQSPNEPPPRLARR
jgi:hypothetical protein